MRCCMQPRIVSIGKAVAEHFPAERRHLDQTPTQARLAQHSPQPHQIAVNVIVAFNLARRLGQKDRGASAEHLAVAVVLREQPHDPAGVAVEASVPAQRGHRAVRRGGLRSRIRSARLPATGAAVRDRPCKGAWLSPALAGPKLGDDALRDRSGTGNRNTPCQLLARRSPVGMQHEAVGDVLCKRAVSRSVRTRQRPSGPMRMLSYDESGASRSSFA